MDQTTVDKILAIARELNADDYRKPLTTGNTLNDVLVELNYLKKQHQHDKDRIATIINHVTDYSIADFEKRIPISEARDEIDVISMGINTFIEELSSTTVSKEYFDALLQSLSEVVWSANANLSKFTYINSAVKEMFDVSVQEALINKDKLEERTYPEDIAYVQIQQKALFAKGACSYLYRIVTPGLNIKWLYARAHLVYNEEGAIERIDGVYGDITKFKEAEQKEQFLASMSHELRTPLNSIIGLMNLLAKSQDLSAKHSKYVEIVRLNSKNLMGLINNLLDFSRIKSGQVELEEQAFNLKSELKAVVDSLSYTAQQKGVCVTFKFPNSFHGMVISDSTRINQIVMNLLSNAIKFTPAGNVLLSVAIVDETTKEITLLVQVKDDGVGIPRNKQKDIFDAFAQANADITRVFGGTGLGLSIVKRLLKLFNSEIKLESEEGKGALFSFELTLPKAIKDVAEKKEIVGGAPANTLANKRLLLVEDNAFNRMVAIDTITDINSSIIVDTADNGIVALERLQQYPYDLILMDINLPEMDGYTASQKIREELKLNTPIVAMTAYGLLENADKFAENGINHYLSKPIVEEQLRDKLVELLGEG